MESRTIQIEGGLSVAPNSRSDVAVVFCPQPNIRAHHKLLIRQGLGLGEKDEEYVQMPLLGGGAVLAHPEYFISELDCIRTSLEIMSGHFGVSCLVAIGHEHCLRMGNFHKEVNGNTDPSCVLDDMVAIRQMHRERSLSSQCPVRKMFAEFKIDLSTIYMKFPTGNKLDYIVVN